MSTRGVPRGADRHGGARHTARTGPFISTVAVSFLFILGVSIVVPVLPLIVEHYGVTRAGGGLLLSSFALGRLAFDLTAGWLGDRFGIRRVALTACVVTIVASIAAATMPSYPVLLAMRVLQGVGSSLYMTVAMSHVITLAPAGYVGRMMAIYQGVILAGVSLGPAVGGVVTEWWGIPGPFVLYAAFGLVGVVIASRWMPPRTASTSKVSRTRDAGSGNVRALLTDPTFLLVLLAGFSVFAVRAGVVNTVIPLFAAERFGFSQTAIGILLTSAVAGNLAVLAHAGRSVDRSRRRTLRLGLWSAVPVVLSLAVVVSPWMLFVLAAGTGIAKGYANVVPAAVLSDLAHPEIRGTAVGIQRMTFDLGLFLGPMLLGGAADLFGYPWTFVLAGTGMALVALATVFMRETGTSPAMASTAVGPELSGSG